MNTIRMASVIIVAAMLSVFCVHEAACVGLLYGSYLGGSGQELCMGICANEAAGRYYILGSTLSDNYPVTGGAYSDSHSSLPYYYDAVVSAFNIHTHELVASTYFGGDGNDYPLSLDNDDLGNLYVCGWTYSTDLPTRPDAYDPIHNGASQEGFIVSMTPDLDHVRWCTYIGGDGFDIATAILYSDGYVYVGAQVDSGAVPVTFEYVPGGNMLVVKLEADTGAMVWCGIIGTGVISGMVVAEDLLLVSGTAREIPVSASAYDNELGGEWDGFVMALEPATGAVSWGTYLGGSDRDGTMRVAIGHDSTIYYAMYTSSADYPLTPGSWGDEYRGGNDMVVGALSSDGASLLWAKSISGSDNEGTNLGDADPMIVLDDTNQLYVCSASWSNDVTTGESSLYPDNMGSSDGLIASVSADGETCNWVTYYGSDNKERCHGILVYPQSVLVVGSYFDIGGEGNIPITGNAYDATFNGDADIFVAMLEDDGVVPTLVTDVSLVQEVRSVVLSLQVGPLSPGDVLRAEVEADAVRTPLVLLDEGNGRYVACDDAACGGGQGARRYLVSLVGPDGEAAEILSRTLLPDCSPSHWGLSAAVSPDGGILFAVQAERPASARVSVFDLMGRRVAALEPAGMAVGLNTLEWDLRDAGGRRVPAGTYVARCVVAERVLTTRFLVLR